MPEQTPEDALTSFLQHGAHRTCLLFVHPDIERLEALKRALDLPRLSIGEALSEMLLGQPSQQRRPRAAQQALAAAIRARDEEVLLCTEIDLLFEPALDLDPLTLFKRLSRSRPLVVLWPGTYEEALLSYALPEHAHYRTWSRPEVSIFPL